MIKTEMMKKSRDHANFFVDEYFILFPFGIKDSIKIIKMTMMRWHEEVFN
jgi:hypothetical protein